MNQATNVQPVHRRINCSFSYPDGSQVEIILVPGQRYRITVEPIDNDDLEMSDGRGSLSPMSYPLEPATFDYSHGTSLDAADDISTEEPSAQPVPSSAPTASILSPSITSSINLHQSQEVLPKVGSKRRATPALVGTKFKPFSPTSIPPVPAISEGDKRELYGAASENFPDTKLKLIEYFEAKKTVWELFQYYHPKDKKEWYCLAKCRFENGEWEIGKVGKFCGAKSVFASQCNLQRHWREHHVGLKRGEDPKKWTEDQRMQMREMQLREDEILLGLVEETDPEKETCNAEWASIMAEMEGVTDSGEEEI